MTLSPVGAARRLVFFAIIPFLAMAGPLSAQNNRPRRDFRDGMRTGIGYAGAMPDAIIGLGLFHFVGDRPIGLFADWKITALSGIREDDEYCPTGIAECTASWVLAERNDQHLDDRKEWRAFNAGIAYALTPDFAVLLGGGLARETRFQQFFDNNTDQVQRLTDSGAYYVDDDIAPAWTGQAVLGVLLRAGRSLAFRVGYETAIGGLGLGAYFRLR